MSRVNKRVLSSSFTGNQLIEELKRSLNQGDLTDAQLRAFLEFRNPFDKSEVHENLEILPVASQLAIWKKYRPRFDDSYVAELADRDLPDFAEGWGVVPKPSLVFSSYQVAFETILAILCYDCDVLVQDYPKIRSGHFNLSEKTARIISSLEAITPGDFLVIPFQFGRRFAGRDYKYASHRSRENEFFLGPYEVAGILLTHARRISENSRMNIICGGGAYDLGGEDLNFCMSFYWSNISHCQIVDTVRNNFYHHHWGYITAFI